MNRGRALYIVVRPLALVNSRYSYKIRGRALAEPASTVVDKDHLPSRTHHT